MHLQNHKLYVSDGKTQSSSVFHLRKAKAALTTDQMTTCNMKQLCSSLPSAPRSFVMSFSSLFWFVANSFTVLFQSLINLNSSSSRLQFSPKKTIYITVCMYYCILLVTHKMIAFPSGVGTERKSWSCQHVPV